MDVIDQSHVSSPLPTSISLPSPRLEPAEQSVGRHNQVGTVMLYGVPIVSLVIDGMERLCLAQISNTLLKQDFSYNEIHNRRVALGITCVQCTPVQLEILRRAGAMPISSRRCGMISKREAERLCKSFLGDNSPPKLPDNFAFEVLHECAWGCRGSFVPSRYNSSRAKCIKCFYCSLFFSPNKFVFHSHRLGEGKYIQPDAANFNSWRRHIRLYGDPPEEITHAWEDVKAMFNGGTRKRLMQHHSSHSQDSSESRLSKSSRLSNVISKGSSFSAPPGKNIPGNDGAPGGYTPYFGAAIPPLAHTYPMPVAQKSLDMRQTFVDYLWGSRTGIPPLGLPYPLPWPKRPVPSFPHFHLADPEALAEGGPEASDAIATEKSDMSLRQTSASAFTPVSRPTPPPSPRTPSVQGGLKAWKKEEPKEALLWEDAAVLPDSSKVSDDESLDVESNEEAVCKGASRETLSQERRLDDMECSQGLCVAGSSNPSGSPISLLSRAPSPPSPCQPSEGAIFPSGKTDKASSSISSSISPSPSNIPSSSFPSPFPPLESPFCLLPDEDPRLRLFLLREMEARRRMEVEMARLKYSYSAHFQPPTLHPTALHPSALSSGALSPVSHLQIGSKEWLETTARASSSSH